MSARLLCSGRSLIFTYVRNLRWFCLRTREFSSQGRSNNSSERSPPPDVKEVPGEQMHTWLNIKAGIFGPNDNRLPLPGDVGLGSELNVCTQTETPTPSSQTSEASKSPLKSGLLPVFLQHIDHPLSLKQEETLDLTYICDADSDDASMSHPSEVFECHVQECPDLVKIDFVDLFPGRNIRDPPLSVLTLSQKTKNDMVGWSEEMENEHETLSEYFVEAAKHICQKLISEGFWGDFIDPFSGRPFHGPYTNATFFETDERYRHFGFKVEDVGCCKVISHRNWGTHVFVGSIFTNARADSEVILNIVDAHDEERGSYD